MLVAIRLVISEFQETLNKCLLLLNELLRAYYHLTQTGLPKAYPLKYSNQYLTFLSELVVRFSSHQVQSAKQRQLLNELCRTHPFFQTPQKIYVI